MQAGTAAACVTRCDRPPIVRLADLELLPVFARTLYLIVAFPWPLSVATEIHPTSSDTDHAQSDRVVTETVPSPPAAGMDRLDGSRL